mmetsp:Transcript_65390/g.160999  ORF Transcript_65390/g.160999 Transcript_65390/m.160999 type:complete len:1316 (+) Transcript_65390:100-4047(+)
MVGRALIGAIALALVGSAACGLPSGASPVLRMRGGAEEVAELGRAQQPLKRANAFKIARVLSETFDKPALGGTKKAAGATVTDPVMAKKLQAIGYKEEEHSELDDPFLMAYVNLKLAAAGVPMAKMGSKEESFMRLVEPILKSYQEQQHLLSDKGFALCPADQRIQNFINNYLSDTGEAPPTLPVHQLKLDRHGLSKMLCLPKGEDLFKNDIITSYRIAQGVLHNPKNDKRTTAGVFHVSEGGLPISFDKKTVPKIAFQRLLSAALNPPEELLTLPYTSNQEKPAKIFASLLLRPLACPEVEGFTEEKTSEVRFIVPGSMVCNLDFVESIFGNGDNPDLAENDAALDPEHWTGTTGCVILAPHLVKMKKKDLGLPHVSKATDLQKRDGMCYDKDDELYNNGGAFKVCARDSRGVMVTVIADNYFGYCKKEVKTQLGYCANVHGQTEEEHAGGCLAYPSYDLGEEMSGKDLGKIATKGNAAFLGETHRYFTDTGKSHSWKEVVDMYGDTMDIQPEGYGIDKEFKDIIYVPEDATFSLTTQKVTFGGKTINMKPDSTYILPCGYKVEMVKKGENNIKTKKGAQSGNPYTKWHLKGTVAEGSFLHKPATVSGGGKSEISKRLEDMVRYGPVFTSDISSDFDKVEDLIKHDFSKMMKDSKVKNPMQEAGIKDLLDPKLSLGRMIRVLSPCPEFTDEHNSFISAIPTHIRELLCVLKQNYKTEWGENWRTAFHTDAINGALGHEVKAGEDGALLSSYLRLGFRSKYDEDIPLKTEDTHNVAWRTFTLRQDFFPSFKLQTEDDISASVVVPRKACEKGLCFREKNPSLKFVQNVEFRLFQRPDEAIHRGFDKTTELDMSKQGNFISNFQPLQRDDVRAIVEDTIGFQKWSEPMQKLLTDFLEADSPEYCVSSAHPRLVDEGNGVFKPTKNPRYLQDSQEVTRPRDYHMAAMATRFARKIPLGHAVHTPVNAVLCGRRNNPPDETSKPPQPALAVHNPVHYYELPELLMEFASSMTGKSPSTTGAGSEGALTKGPFNALSMIHDMNNALVSYALTNSEVYITSAGVIGPHHQVDHDISLLVPEVWCRMRDTEKDSKYLIKEGFLEKIEDFEFEGTNVPASVLGYRITDKFVNAFFGRVVADPSTLFPERMLRPELQDIKTFKDGIETITVTNKRVAEAYFADGAVNSACPPMKALLHIMRDGEFEGKKISDPEIRKLFTREYIIGSDWYKARLAAFQKKETMRLERSIEHMDNYLKSVKANDWKGQQIVADLKLDARLEKTKKRLEEVKKPSFLSEIEGSLGVDPALLEVKGNNLDKPIPLA